MRNSAATGGAAEVWIYDEIGLWGVSARDFTTELVALDADAITVHLNSPGGDVFDGVAIYRALKDHPANVTTRVDSIAASIASVIAMAGDRVLMTRRSMMMIHEPFALSMGTAGDMRKAATALDKMGDTIAGIYSDRAGGTAAEWRARMADETWFSDDEAVDAGLADEVLREAAAKNSFDLSIFRHAPKLPEQQDDPEPEGWVSASDRLLQVARARLEVANAHAR